MRIDNKLLATLKEHKPRKGGKERRFECPTCGRAKKNEAPLEINTRTGLGHCFKCHLSFKITLDDVTKKAIKQYYSHESKGDPVSSYVPHNLERVFDERNCDMAYTCHRYKVGWDGYRLCWQVGEGYWRRSIYTMQEPKVIVDENAQGLLGEHLLERGKNWIVVTEGDWKAANIPLPFVGVASGGHGLTKHHVDILRYYRPKLVIVAWDGGVDPEQDVNKLKARALPVVSINLPEGKGPDDVPRWDLVDRLLEVSVDIK